MLSKDGEIVLGPCLDKIFKGLKVLFMFRVRVDIRIRCMVWLVIVVRAWVHFRAAIRVQ